MVLIIVTGTTIPSRKKAYLNKCRSMVTGYLSNATQVLMQSDKLDGDVELNELFIDSTDLMLSEQF